LAAESPLDVFFYGIGEVSADWPSTTTDSGVCKALPTYGFKTCPAAELVVGIPGCLAYYSNIGKQRPKLPYEIDGAMYKVDNLQWQQRPGFVSRAPRWSLALRFPAQEEMTIVKGKGIEVKGAWLAVH